MRRLLLLAAALLLWGTACESYSCGDAEVLDYHFGEQCGVAGSFGFLYIDDGMTQLLLEGGAPLGSEDFSISLDWLPAVVVGFRNTHLQAGETLGPDELVAWCSRMHPDPYGIFTTWPAESRSLEVIASSKKEQLGGQTWRMRWDIQCAEAQMHYTGEDLIELMVEANGYSFGTYGTPSAR